MGKVSLEHLLLAFDSFCEQGLSTELYAFVRGRLIHHILHHRRHESDQPAALFPLMIYLAPILPDTIQSGRRLFATELIMVEQLELTLLQAVLCDIVSVHLICHTRRYRATGEPFIDSRSFPKSKRPVPCRRHT